MLRARDGLIAAQGGDDGARPRRSLRQFPGRRGRCAWPRNPPARWRGRGGWAGFAVAGGVAANRSLRARLEAVAADAGLPLLSRRRWHCATDNAAMIAFAGLLASRPGSATT